MSARDLPRLVIAGTAGDSGKTLLSMGLLVTWRAQGYKPAAFKKGPDYIDAAWLSRAAASPCYNLDTYLQERRRLVDSFLRHGSPQINLLEGNRGFLDGVDAEGTHSTASLAQLLCAPVVLIVSVRKVTRTVAALVLGCRELAREVTIGGVVLNRVAGSRQEAIIRRAVEELTGIPVLGALPEQHKNMLPDRHLGLVPPQEHAAASEILEPLARLIQDHVEVDQLWQLARQAPALEEPEVSQPTADKAVNGADHLSPCSDALARGAEPASPDPCSSLPLGAARGLRCASSEKLPIVVFSDAAFTFYYPDNLAALEEAGAELIYVSALADRTLPAAAGLYLGGGFPETHAATLAGNAAMHEQVRAAAERGMPIYAECGGLIYLSHSVRVDGRSYAMSGVLPLQLELLAKPQGHGYMEVLVDRPNPFFSRGLTLRGHEFHYTRLVEGHPPLATVLEVQRGTGLGRKRDGIIYNNVFAGYMHLHALGAPSWAPSLVRCAADYWRQRHGRGLKETDPLA